MIKTHQDFVDRVDPFYRKNSNITLNKWAAITELLCHMFHSKWESKVGWKQNDMNWNICEIEKADLMKKHFKLRGFSLLWKLANTGI